MSKLDAVLDAVIFFNAGVQDSKSKKQGKKQDHNHELAGSRIWLFLGPLPFLMVLKR